jgi:hypothetical protein
MTISQEIERRILLKKQLLELTAIEIKNLYRKLAEIRKAQEEREKENAHV